MKIEGLHVMTLSAKIWLSRIHVSEGKKAPIIDDVRKSGSSLAVPLSVKQITSLFWSIYIICATYKIGFGPLESSRFVETFE
jgi:hypothetical protein